MLEICNKMGQNNKAHNVHACMYMLVYRTMCVCEKNLLYRKFKYHKK